MITVLFKERMRENSKGRVEGVEVRFLPVVRIYEDEKGGEGWISWKKHQGGVDFFREEGRAGDDEPSILHACIPPMPNHFSLEFRSNHNFLLNRILLIGGKIFGYAATLKWPLTEGSLAQELPHGLALASEEGRGGADALEALLDPAFGRGHWMRREEGLIATKYISDQSCHPV